MYNQQPETSNQQPLNLDEMQIKASTITNLTDARYFAAKEVDFLGFNLEEGTDGYLEPIYMKAIREWVEGPKIVGEFDRTPARTVLEAAAFYELDAMQVSQAEDLHLLDGLEIIFYLKADTDLAALEARLRELAPLVSYFLLDFSENDQAAKLLREQAADWKTLFQNYPVLLDINLAADALADLLQLLQPAGLALRGGEEERVGVKSYDAIDAIFESM